MKKGAVVFCGVILISALYGCSAKYEEVVVPETVIETTTPAKVEVIVEEDETEPLEPEERIELDGKIKSYLTGEMTDAAKADRRPVAVMMSNDKAALPQYGINDADVVYEAPVEGGMNRFMGIFENYDELERIGSVRSCRTYYTYFAREFNAIYAHFGQSTFAMPYLKNVDNINGLEGIGGTAYFRSKDRKSPHNAYTGFSYLQSTIEKLGYSQEYDKNYKGHYKFSKNGVQIELKDGEDAYKVVPGYTINNPWFVYNDEDGLYYRYQYGSEHKGDKGQISVKNIIFQYCQSGYYATTEYLNLNVHTSEKGYYITNGKVIPVQWKKEGEFGPTRYYNSDGEEITLNQGKTWVCVISTRDYAKAEFYGKQ